MPYTPYFHPYPRPPFPPDANGIDMNLLAYYPDPVLSAKCVDNRRITKLTLEAHQIICGALANWGVPDAPYKPSHIHHPVTQWVWANASNCWWAIQHAGALIEERHAASYNYAKSAGVQDWCVEAFIGCQDFSKTVLNNEQPLSFQNSAAHAELGLNYRHLSDVHSAYQQYSIKRWENELAYGIKPRWRDGYVPAFIQHHSPDFYEWLYERRHDPLQDYSKPKPRPKPTTARFAPLPKIKVSMNHV